MKSSIQNYDQMSYSLSDAGVGVLNVAFLSGTRLEHFEREPLPEQLVCYVS